MFAVSEMWWCSVQHWFQYNTSADGLLGQVQLLNVSAVWLFITRSLSQLRHSSLCCKPESMAFRVRSRPLDSVCDSLSVFRSVKASELGGLPEDPIESRELWLPWQQQLPSSFFHSSCLSFVVLPLWALSLWFSAVSPNLTWTKHTISQQIHLTVEQEEPAAQALGTS